MLKRCSSIWPNVPKLFLTRVAENCFITYEVISLLESDLARKKQCFILRSRPHVVLYSSNCQPRNKTEHWPWYSREHEAINIETHCSEPIVTWMFLDLMYRNDTVSLSQALKSPPKPFYWPLPSTRVPLVWVLCFPIFTKNYLGKTKNWPESPKIQFV